MNKIKILLFLLISYNFYSQEVTITSWNIQTFFDSVTQGTEYSDFKKSKNWNLEKYKSRLENLCTAINILDSNIIIFQEIENKEIIYDIYNKIAYNNWNKNKQYKYAYFAKNSNNATGCAIISQYKITKTATHNFYINKTEQTQLRPILEVDLEINKKPLKLIINHWKSKSGGEEITEKWRIQQEDILYSIFNNNKDKKIIACGDFNKNIEDFIIKDEYVLLNKLKNNIYKEEQKVYCPWLDKKFNIKIGSYYYNNKWQKIDHFFINDKSLIKDFSVETNLLWNNENFIPKRYILYNNTGFSDHLPIKCKIIL